jgi:hypothetical protein
MGVKSLTKSLADPEIMVFNYKLRNDLGKSTISEMIKTSHNPEVFMHNAFHPSLEQSSTSKLCMRYSCWDVYPSIEIVDGVEYHQCQLGPDQWSNCLKNYKELEAEVSLTNPQYDTWKQHDDHY